MSYHQPFQVTGFHSCDRDLGLRLLNGSDELRPSNNPWDWLGLPPYDTIRSPFHEGGPIYSGANFTDRLHIEICVLNPKCIKGYFLPRPSPLFNPYLARA
jgi:hypothetical protein